MRYSWFLILPIIAIAGIVIYAWLRYRAESESRDLKKVAVIAHTSTIKKLPAYRKAVTQYRILLAAAIVLFLISTFSLTVAAARPTARHTYNSEDINRDVVLCIDVSGSMYSYIPVLLDEFNEIIDKLYGQRISITIFDSVPANLIPLSDDYDAVKDLVSDLKENFRSYSVGTIRGDLGSSVIGDGVMGCINSFGDYESSERSRSVIIATDNEVAGKETVDINQAARYAKRYNITFYGLSIKGFNSYSNKLFEKATQITGGAFYNIGDMNQRELANQQVLHSIFDQEAAKIAGAAQTTYVDSPELALIVAGVSLALFIAVIWRLRL